MKTKISQLVLSLVAGWGAMAAVQAAPAANPNGANALAEVVFLEPAKFTDVRDSDMGDYTRTSYLEQLRDHVLDRAKYHVPAGYRLAVTITDIDMAGDFEPWRGPRLGDVRIVKDIYPPRIALSFQLVDGEGNIVKQGQRELRDLAFLMKITSGFRDDSLRHEKALLDDWMRNDLPRVKKN